jgi:hypothetical protein
MSAVEGICLHQITGALEKIKDNLQEDLSKMDTAADWSLLWNHIEHIEQLIEDINNA